VERGKGNSKWGVLGKGITQEGKLLRWEKEDEHPKIWDAGGGKNRIKKKMERGEDS